MQEAKANPFLELKQVNFLFNEDSAKLKEQALLKCSGVKISGANAIKQYHDALLFLLAYPENENLKSLAESEMKSLAERIKKLPASQREKLDLSGLAFTNTHGGFSISLIKWLLKEFPHQARIHSFDEEGVHPKEILKHALGEMEFEIASDEKLKSEGWVAKASGTKNKNKQLQWIINQFEKIEASDLFT